MLYYIMLLFLEAVAARMADACAAALKGAEAARRGLDEEQRPRDARGVVINTICDYYAYYIYICAYVNIYIYIYIGTGCDILPNTFFSDPPLEDSDK